MFPPKPDIRKDGQTYGRTDISNYRVALLLKITEIWKINNHLRYMSKINILFYHLDPYYFPSISDCYAKWEGDTQLVVVTYD